MKTLLVVVAVFGFTLQASANANCKGMQSGNLFTAPVNPVKTAQVTTGTAATSTKNVR